MIALVAGALAHATAPDAPWPGEAPPGVAGRLSVVGADRVPFVDALRIAFDPPIDPDPVRPSQDHRPAEPRRGAPAKEAPSTLVVPVPRGRWATCAVWVHAGGDDRRDRSGLPPAL